MTSSSFQKAFQQLRIWGSVVKFSHTIFALPFALAMYFIVLRFQTFQIDQLFWILVALVSARTAAMGYNRLIDRYIDARNARTSEREVASGRVSISSVSLLVALSSLIFILAAAALGRHCLYLSPLVLLVLLGYSWTKRFTAAAHLVLGLALACAPGGVWYALTAQFNWLPVWLMLAVLCWVAGFDILYSCQDLEFDKEEGLFSVPAKFGIENAFKIAWYLHLSSLVLLCTFGLLAGLNWPYYVGLAVFAAILISQHYLINPRDLKRIDAAFFNRNGLAACVYFLAVMLEYLYTRLL